MQLVELGITSKQVATRVRGGRLHPVHRGVYLVGHGSPSPQARLMAAVLAGGTHAVISHLSAAKLLRLPAPEATRIDVTVIATSTPSRPGIRFHRTCSLCRRDVRRVDRIPLTSPARTLLDVSSVLCPAAIERAVAEAQSRNLVRRSELRDHLARHPGRPGTPSLRALVSGPAPSRIRSEAEAKLLALIRAADLPRPETNAPPGPYELDFLWREQRLVVEVDGFAFHSSRRAFESDRRRDADLAARGYTVIRTTWRQLVDEPHVVVARIAAALARASS